MQLFYNETLQKGAKELLFDKVESKHIVRVLRKSTGDVLHITNGKGLLFTAEIIVASDKKCLAKITQQEVKPKPWNYYVHLAIAPTKLNDRLEWFLEKATEIGVDEITPIICQNSERRVVKLERYEKIIQAAMKQSLKFTLPKINEPVKFSDFIQQEFNTKVCIAHCETGDKKLLREVISPKENSIILIGPEGDFSAYEIGLATAKNCIPISLGESRLRTETAGLVAVQNMAFINQ